MFSISSFKSTLNNRPSGVLLNLPSVSQNIVTKWTSHSDYKAMKPYIDIVDSIKASSMMKIDGLIQSSHTKTPVIDGLYFDMETILFNLFVIVIG